MKSELNLREMIALGFMAFALFLGAGNIIFPPFIGIQAGSNVWTAAAGFLLTGVGLPVLAIIALARAGGDLGNIISPVGHVAGNLLIIDCYLFIGPLFASPRTATVAYELGLAPLAGHSQSALVIYSFCYFTLAALISLFPGRLLESVGQVLAPLKIVALIVLCCAVFWLPDVPAPAPRNAFITSPFSGGIVNGYLTMDTLAGLAFGLVVVNAIRARGLHDRHHITRYTTRAGIIAGAGLAVAYLSLFTLGLKSVSLIPDAANGTEVLHAFVQHVFGDRGVLFLAVLMSLACIVTAIGLTCSCASYFSTLTPFGYKTLVIFFATLSFLVSCMGLNALIRISIPVLIMVYPPFITLIVCGFFKERLPEPVKVIAPATAVAFVCGVLDGLHAAGLTNWVPSVYLRLPLSDQQMSWLLPTAVVLLIGYFMSRIMRTPSILSGVKK